MFIAYKGSDIQCDSLDVTVIFFILMKICLFRFELKNEQVKFKDHFQFYYCKSL